MINRYLEISEMVGKIFSKVYATDDELIFEMNNGDRYIFYHEQDCCESVEIEDINGDLNFLVDTPLLMADESTNEDNPKEEWDESFTWTFYKFATIKGYVDVRWYGASNGYYSEGVDLRKETNEEE